MAIFTNDILPTFSKINNQKDRRDFETVNGAKNERLFRKILEMVNDTGSADLDELILLSNLEMSTSVQQLMTMASTQRISSSKAGSQ
jgi:hypothetical protein